MHVTHKTIHKFSTMQGFAITHFGNLPANFGFVMLQNCLIHVIMGFEHDVPCIVRLEALSGHPDTRTLDFRKSSLFVLQNQNHQNLKKKTPPEMESVPTNYPN